MRVLMTGATSLQVKPPEKRRATVTKIDVPGAVVDVMREAGHTVDWRATDPGEDLSGYDVLWINVAGVNSVNATPGGIGMLWAMAQEDVPAVVFLDDWKTKLTYQQARNFAKAEDDNIYFDRHLLSGIKNLLPDANPTHYTRQSADAEWRRVVLELRLSNDEAEKIRPTPFYAQRLKYTAEEWESFRPVVVEGARAMMRGRRNSIIGIPAYRWGSTDVVLPTLPAPVRDQEIVRLDPSFIAASIAASAPHSSDQREAWGLAALGDHTEWLDKYLPDRTWSVDCIGHRTNRKVKTEQDVVEFYSSTSAILSPSYYHAGSGWWRSRFVYAAALEMPIYAADGEAAPLGDAYNYTPTEIEALSAPARDELGRAQQSALWPLLSSRDEFAAQVELMLERAVR